MRHQAFFVQLVIAAGLTLSACSSGSSNSSQPAPAANGSGGFTGVVGGGGFPGTGGGQGGAATGSGGCAGSMGGSSTIDPGSLEPSCEAGKYIYLTSVENALLRFEPKSATITKVGDLKCDGAGKGESPFAIAIDRRNVAWVLFTDGSLHFVDTTTLACTKTSFKPGQSGFTRFDMAFVKNPGAGDDETLYAVDLTDSMAPTTKGLASINIFDGTLTPIGSFDGRLASQRANLTGRGDGKLFGYFFPQQTKPTIAEIDRTTSKILSDVPQPVAGYTPWVAFAHWGGSYYIFYNYEPAQRSRIDRYTPGKGTKRLLDDAGYVLNGASVSTCAPVATDIR